MLSTVVRVYVKKDCVPTQNFKVQKRETSKADVGPEQCPDCREDMVSFFVSYSQ